jgi:hypothetical protein
MKIGIKKVEVSLNNQKKILKNINFRKETKITKIKFIAAILFIINEKPKLKLKKMEE